MLQFLETGRALYVLVAVCVLGIAGKLVTRSLYKRLIKETDNMALTRNKNLKALRQKLENTYRLNQTILNTQAYVEKQIYGFRFMKVSLDGWNNLSSQMTLLGLFLGGAGSFLSYWYRLDSYYIVLYGSVAILGGLLQAFVDSSVNIAGRRQRLETALLEYIENTAFGRAGREAASAGEPETGRSSVRAAKDRGISLRDKVLDGGGLQNRRREARYESRDDEAVDLSQADDFSGDQKEEAPLAPSRKRGGRVGKNMIAQQDGSGSRNDIEYLKHSLEQIAASREKPKGKEDWTKDLNQEEMQVLGEIIREYFGNK